jgi:hypothetical protein
MLCGSNVFFKVCLKPETTLGLIATSYTSKNFLAKKKGQSLIFWGMPFF